MMYLLPLAIGLAIGSAAMLAFAEETGVTASVACNETNRHYSAYCMDWDDAGNVSGQIYGTEFYTIWITPERMLFWTPTAYWYVTPTGIEI